MGIISAFRTTRALAAGSALAAAFAIVAQTSFAQSKPHLAGDWNFNQDQSDDANQKIHDAQAQARSQRGGYPGGGYPGGGYPGGGYPGGGYPGGGGVGFPGGRGGMGGMGRGRQGGGMQGAGLSSDDMEQLAATPKTLKIDQDDNKVTITSDSGEVTNLYPDGKKHKEADATGQSTTIKTRWDGDHLVSESKLHSGKLTQNYELSSDGKQLYVIATLESGRRSDTWSSVAFTTAPKRMPIPVPSSSLDRNQGSKANCRFAIAD